MTRRVSVLGFLTVLGGCAVEVGGPEPGELYTTSGSGYSTLSINGSPTSTPAHLQADLNIKLRGMGEVNEARTLIDINGPTDSGAPKINTLFVDGRVPGMARLYKVGKFGGLATGLEGGYPVHVVELVTSAGETVRTPRSGYDIGGGKTALVLYADADSLTLKYTREDSIVHGYAIHLLGLKVDAALLALYRSCVAAGRSELPALAGGQAVGTAGATLMVSVRDTGQFMDPRARKDWYEAGASAAPPPSAPPAPPSTPPAPPPSTPPAPPPTNPPAPAPSTQGTSCSAGDVQLALDQAPAACGHVTLTVTASQAHAWVLAGVAAPGSGVQWKGGATDVGCGGGTCHWTFKDLPVPCQAGPYTLRFMKDAVNDDPSLGQQVASCQP